MHTYAEVPHSQQIDCVPLQNLCGVLSEIDSTAYNTHTHIAPTGQQLIFIRTFHVRPVIAFLKDLPMVYTAILGAIHMPRKIWSK